MSVDDKKFKQLLCKAWNFESAYFSFECLITVTIFRFGEKSNSSRHNKSWFS